MSGIRDEKILTKKGPPYGFFNVTVSSAKIVFLEAKTMSKKALKGKVWQAINFLYQNFIQKKAFFVSDSSMCSIALIEKSGGQYGCFDTIKQPIFRFQA